MPVTGHRSEKQMHNDYHNDILPKFVQNWLSIHNFLHIEFQKKNPRRKVTIGT